MTHQPVGQGQTITPGTLCPTLCDKRVGSLTSPANHVTYPRRLEQEKTLIHLQMYQRQRILLGVEPSASRTADWRPTNGANEAAVNYYEYGNLYVLMSSFTDIALEGRHFPKEIYSRRFKPTILNEEKTNLKSMFLQ